MNLIIGVLVSGSGSNLQAILDSIEDGFIPNAVVGVVISNKKEAYAIERAKKHGVEALFIDPKSFQSPEEFNGAVADELIKRNINLVCLAGYLLLIKGKLLKEFKGRILNIHPALLPKFGGKGMYGHHVHESVIKSGEKKSGATIHIVDEKYDHGSTILQREIDVFPGETPENLAKRILEIEHIIYPEALKLIAEDKIKLHITK
ncbi:MAG: phosphoribosylglycinamide formyltransferase [bacterium]